MYAHVVVEWERRGQDHCFPCKYSTCSSCFGLPGCSIGLFALHASFRVFLPEIVPCLLPVGVLFFPHPPLWLPLDRINVLPVPKPWELSSSYLKGIWWLCHGEFVLWKTVFFPTNLSIHTDIEVILNAVGESFDVPQSRFESVHTFTVL